MIDNTVTLWYYDIMIIIILYYNMIDNIIILWYYDNDNTRL